MSHQIISPSSVIPRGRIALNPTRGLFMIECAHEERAWFFKKVVWTPVNRLIEAVGVRESVVHYFGTRDEAADHARLIGIDLEDVGGKVWPRSGITVEA